MPSLIALITFFVSACNSPQTLDIGKKIKCGAEVKTANGKYFISPSDTSILIGGGKQQTDKEAHSGKYSVITYGKKAFAFGMIQKSGPDWYYKVSVWRKSNSENGILVATTKDLKHFYKTTKEPVAKDSSGWEKLELEVFTPPFFREGKDILQVYVWNNSKDTVYFDDFQIERLSKKEYPVYNEQPLSIVLDTSEYIKLYKKREKAFENGILENSGNDWVKGIVFGDGKMMKAKLRLKGDWLDHLYGDKWSFRIKLKKKYAWRRLRVFSIQTPAARDFLMEWASHRFYESKDILTTRYGFVPVLINNSSRGIYAYEEHFVKQLVESRRRREGPIVKFSEDAFWQQQKMAIKYNKWVQYPFFEASVIEPFSESKTLKNPVLYNDFLNAQKLMYQYKYHLRKPSDIFDIDKLAKYYAMLDLTLARHGMAWHNQRFYYNPMLCKLEPIAYDGYTDHSHENRGIEDNFYYIACQNNSGETLEEHMNYDLFSNAEFVNLYIHFLQNFSSKHFVDSVNQSINSQAHLYDSLVKIEFPQMVYDFDFYKKSAKKIREYLPALKQLISKNLADTTFRFTPKQYNYKDTTVLENTPEFFVTAYVEQKNGDSSKILVENYFPKKITLLGTGNKKGSINFHFNKIIHLKTFKDGTLVNDTVEADTNNRYLFFMVEGKMDTYVIKIRPWPKPHGITTQQELMQMASINLPVIDKVVGKDIFIKTGNQIVDYPVVVPAGYRVLFNAGTHIDFIKKAFFLSYSPVLMRGTQKNKVIITSSDFSANGFTVLQPKSHSILNWVRFENLNTLNYKTWTITGSVTFYEANLTISNTTFYRNQCEDALNLVRCKFTMNNSTFDYTHSDAFDSDFSNGTASNIILTNVGNDAFDFSGSKITIVNCTVKGTNDKGVSAGEDSHVIVENCKIANANIGLASKDLSTLKATNTTVTDCNYGAVLLQKKPEYGEATMNLKNVKFIRPKTKWIIENGSYIKMDDTIVKGNKKDVRKIFY